MQKPKAIRLAIMSGFVGAVTVVLFAVLTFAIPTAQATPAIAKGKAVWHLSCGFATEQS